ncbi:MBL fold metallo-hydrolase [Methanocella sp. CWC-04]|uniref:MBL fold metallo-hydrolase n=1 Tax=Methanooceanicella nereidis TaxID=2052831 RepID=A0AAP2RE36_9EURY|nr:MBL fold metallo-hydrolase [Methanocella sp. CWC-04]
MKLKKICGDTHYIPGITNVMVYDDIMVDPSNNENVDWDNIKLNFNMALVTHGHTDHFWNGAKLRKTGTKIYAPRDERGFMENPSVNTSGIFNWARPPESMLPWFFKGVPCPVDGTLEDIDDLPLETFPLPGHTQWQTGFLTPDGVLMVSDAIVTKKIWDTKRMVFYTTPYDAKNTLKAIMDSDAEWVLASHADLMTGDEAAELAEINIRGIDSIEAAVIDALEGGEYSTEEMVSRVGVALNVRCDFSMHLIVVTTVRAFLHALYETGKAEYVLRDHRIMWRLR